MVFLQIVVSVITFVLTAYIVDIILLYCVHCDVIVYIFVHLVYIS